MFRFTQISQIERRLARGASVLLLGTVVVSITAPTAVGAEDASGIPGKSPRAGSPGPAVASGVAPAAAATTTTGPVPGAAPAAAAKFVEVPATPALLAQLRNGGYVLYLRHGATDNNIPDRVPTVDLDDCTTQRPLTEAGRAASAAVGEAMRQARIPIAQLYVSPLCRARESAAAAFPTLKATVDENLMYVANLTTAQKAPIIARTRQLLSAPPPAGSNRLLVAHAPNVMELIGYFPKESTLIVFLPRGDGAFEYVASVAPSAWKSLLQ